MGDVIVTRAKDSRENLCDSCIFDYPDCEPEEGLLEFGNGSGNDNIIACDAYRPFNL